MLIEFIYGVCQLYFANRVQSYKFLCIYARKKGKILNFPPFSSIYRTMPIGL